MKKLHFLAAAALMCAASAHAEVEYTDVTADMFHNWTSGDASGVQTEEPTYPEINLGTEVGPGGMVYGYSTVHYLSYANLSEYSELQIVAAGFPRLLFNRTVNEGPCVEYSSADHDWAIVDNGDGTSTYTINLAAMVERDGFAHLHAIKATWGGPVTVSSLKAGKETVSYSFGEPEWLLDGDDVSGFSIAEDQAALGVGVTFPAAVLPENATCTATVMLYGIMPEGAEGGIMPLSADDDVDPGFNNNPTIVALYDEPVEVVGYVEGGVLRFNVAAEDLFVGNLYAISLEKLVATVDDVEVLATEEPVQSPVFTVTEVEVLEVEIEPVFVNGEEEVALNSHSWVSVEKAEALTVNFINAPMVKAATYMIEKLCVDEEGDAYQEDIASGMLSVSTIGYVAFEQPLVFETGSQYRLLVKAWDVEEFWEAEPIAREEFIFNGCAEVAYSLGEPVWGIERFSLPEDMINLGVKVTFPNAKLPEDVNPMDLQITVSASLYGILPEGAEGGIMPLTGEDEVGDDMGVVGPLLLEEAVLHYAAVEGGVITAYLFPSNENFAVGNHYAVMLNSVMVMNGEELVAEMPEDVDWSVDFFVTEYQPTPMVGEPAFGIEGGVFEEDMIALGVPVSFPDMVLPEGVFAEDCEITVSASLYGVPQGNEPMPLSGEDEVGDDNMGVDGPVCLAEAVPFTCSSEGGVVSAMLFPEMLEVGNHYAIMLNAVTVIKDDEILVELPEDAYYAVEFDVVAYEPVGELAIVPAFVNGEEEVALNSHSAVSVEQAEALVVNFENGAMVKAASYAIDQLFVDEDGDVAAVSLATGFLSLNTVGYVAFDEPLSFVAGNQYKVTIKAWDAEEFWENEPIAVEEFLVNGAANVVVVGEPAWGIERGEITDDMINLGVPVSFPEITLPFGVVAEECNIYVTAILAETEAEEIMPFALDDDDDIDGGFGVNSKSFLANVEGGVIRAMLFPEELEVGKTYTIVLTGIQFYDFNDELVAAGDCDAAAVFTVVKGNPVSINGIFVESNKNAYNIFGQKAINANSVVITDGVKVIVK